MTGYSDEYMDALVDLEAEEPALFHLLELYARSPQEWFSERLRASIDERLSIYVNALIYVNDHTDDDTRATQEWQDETERRNRFAGTGVGPVLEVIDILVGDINDREAESPAARHVAQVIHEADELANLIGHVEDDEETRRILAKRHRRLICHALALNEVLPAPLIGDADDGFARCPPLAELQSRVVSAGEDALDLLAPGWRPDEAAT